MNGERILVVMSAYNEEDFIVPNIRHLYPYVDKIAISTTNHITGKNPTDSTNYKLSEFMCVHDNEEKVLYRCPEGIHESNDYDGREGQIKTELMNAMEPEPGDWIWVVDADEFYPKRQLEMLRSRYILNHEGIKKNPKALCLMVTSMVFAYGFNHFYFARHGRIFKYSEGAYFNRVNHFTMSNGTPIYSNEYGWDFSPAYLYMMHMRYVRKNLDRLRNRYIYRQDAAGQKKLEWFDNVFMIYPKDKEKALNWNKEYRGVEGFDGALSGDLKIVVNDEIPEELLKDIEHYQLFNELKYGGN